MRSNLIYLCLLTPFFFLMSCASYNYTSSSNDRSFKITSDNLPDFQVFSTKSSNKLSTASSGAVNVRLESLKKDYLSVLLSHPNYDPQQVFISRTPRTKALAKDIVLGVFTFGIPIIVDVFKSDFYKISPKTKQFQVHFEFKQSFMSDEYTKIKDSKNPDDFKDWLSKYQKSALFQKVLDQKDSLELSIALFQETEQAIDDYIASHQSSTHLPEALKIKEEMVAARELFAKTKTENSVSSYESFLEKYPRSLHNKEAHKLLTDAAEKVAVSSSSSTSMVNYMKNYFIPNAAFFNTSELDQRKSKISKAIDAQLIKENIKTDPKKTYDYYSNLWKAYINMRNQGLDPYLNHLEQTYSYQSKICDVLFLKVKDANTADKQSTLIAKINSDFPKLDVYEELKNPLITVLENTKKGTGTLKLYGANYMLNYFNNLSEISPLKGLDHTVINGEETAPLKSVNFEELSFVNGVISGVNKGYFDSKCLFSINIVNQSAKDVSYFIDGELVKTIFFPATYPSYYNEFDNGVNLTAKSSNEIIGKLSNYEVLMRKYIASKSYSEAISEMISIVPFIQEIGLMVKQNPIPDMKDKWLPKIESLRKLYDQALLKKEESNYFTSNNKYVTPSQINYTMVDNRKVCPCCSYNYAQYTTKDASTIEFEKVAEAVMCNVERMTEYWDKNAVPKNYRDEDIQKYKEYLKRTYTTFQYIMMPMAVDFAVNGVNALKGGLNELAAISGQKPYQFGKLSRDVDKYKLKNKYCSSLKCLNDYRCP